jgi:hypothetical protein
MPVHGGTDNRDNWQKDATANAVVAERSAETGIRLAAAAFHSALTVTPQDRTFGYNLYYNHDRQNRPTKYVRHDTAGGVWYDPQSERYMKNGDTGGAACAKKTQNSLVPDLVITNPDNGRKLVVEVKRQNAAGNAHQRMCRYLGLLPILERLCGGVEKPFAACICGPMATSAPYIAEIQTPFDIQGMSDHVHFYKTEEALATWATTTILPMLLTPPSQ